MKKNCLLICLFFSSALLRAEDGYRLWLRYDKIDDPGLLQQYRGVINSIVIDGSSPTLTIARNELLTDLKTLLDKKISEEREVGNNCIVLRVKVNGTPEVPGVYYNKLGSDGFAITTNHSALKNVI